MLSLGIFLGPLATPSHATGYSTSGQNSDPLSIAKQLLKNPSSLDHQANQDLVKKFKAFHDGMEHGWFHSGLDNKLRQLVDVKGAMKPELLLEVMEAAAKALDLRIAVEHWGRTQDVGGAEITSTLFHYFNEVYVPMSVISDKGKLYPEIHGLELGSVLWPNVFLPQEVMQFTDSQLIRGPAEVLEAGEAALIDPSEYNRSVDPKLNKKLENLAKMLKEASTKQASIAKAMQEYNNLKNSKPVPPHYGRNSRNLTAAQKKARVAADSTYKMRLAEWEKKVSESKLALDKAEPSRGFLGWMGRKVGMLGQSNREKLGDEEVKYFAEAARLTTLQLMIKQIYFYKEIINDTSPFEMQKWGPSCRKAYDVLPQELHFQFEPQDVRLFNMENMLANNGLIFSESEYLQQSDFNEFYLNDRGRDPFKGNLTGGLPFHMLRSAQQGIRYALGEEPQIELSDLKQPYLKATWDDLGVPAFDDLRHFNDVFQIFLEGALPQLKSQAEIQAFNETTQIIMPPAGEFPADGTLEQQDAYIDAAQWTGMTPYLASKMKAMKLEREQWYKAIPNEVIFAWTDNRISMDFPPFYGPESYKQWALRNLYKALLKGRINDSKLKSTCEPSSLDKSNFQLTHSYKDGLGSAEAAAMMPKYSGDFCERIKTQSGVEYLKTLLQPFDDRSPFVPPVAAYDSNLRHNWGNLRTVWKQLQQLEYYWDEEEFPTKFNEWSFIKSQFETNPWVMLRVSTMTKLWELKNGTWTGASNVVAKPIRSGRRRLTTQELEESSIKNHLRSALNELPLAKADLPVQPLYANHLIFKNEESWKFWKDADEKRLFKLWEKIEHHFHEKNLYTFKLPANKNRRSGQDTYGQFEILQRKTLYSEDDVKRTINGFELENQGVDTSEMHELLDIARNENNSEKFEVLKKIMDSPGNTEKHQQLLEEYIFEHGDDETFSSADDIKLSFLKRNQDFQFPLMTQVLKSGAKRRVDELSKDLEKLCRLDPDVESDWDNLMSMTSRTQKMFNEHFEMEGIPESVIKFYDRTTWRERRDYRNMGLMVVGYIGLMMSAAACASGVLSVAGCPAAAIIMATLSGAALAYSGGDFIMNSIEEAATRSDRMELGSRFKEMGFSEQEAVNKRKGRGWGGVAFEVVTGVTMYVPVVQAGKVALRTATTALVRKSAMKRGLNKGIDVGRTAWEIMESKEALKALKFAEKSPSLARTIANVFAKAKNVVKPSAYRQWFMKNFADDVVLNFGKKELDQKTGKALAEWFSNSPEKFNTFLKKDVELKFKKIDKLIAKAEKAMKTSDAAGIQSQRMFAKSQEKYVQKMAKHFNSLDGEASLELIKKTVAKEKKIVTALMNDLGKRDVEARMAEYLGEHMDSIAPILSDLMFKLNRAPQSLLYLMFFQGTPYAYPKVFGRWFARRAFVKHIMASREKLLVHIIRKESTEFLGLGSEVMAVDMLHLLRSGQAAVLAQAADLASKDGDGAALKLAKSLRKDWRTYRIGISQRAFEARNPGKLAKDNWEQVLQVEKKIFESDLSDELALKEAKKALAPNGWTQNMMSKWQDPEKLLDYKNFGESLDILLKRLSTETRDIDKFADYVQLTVLKIKQLAAKGQKTHEVMPY